jgi:DNA helicase-2/ATP-dependent DNA helicase PcrA
VPDLESVLAGLNEAQREAARALQGPVAILAGAGTGKTTTITHRIACQVRGGAFEPSQILAVTFTDKAAGELRARLAALGVEGVEARTFHSAALSQLSRLWSAYTGEPLPEVLDHKAPVISSLANALPPPHKFLPRRELAGEIEWAKNRMIPPERYLDELADHEAPIPAELMLRVYDGYERRKRSMGRLDFEDMLGVVLRLFDEHPEAAERVRSRFAAFTVDEYQDVNPLQTALLERWLGDRDELCVVGDDYQTIYAFTGASPSHLLGFTKRFPHATVVRLEENYRSTPEVLELANRLATRLGGFRKTLRATRPSGPPPLARAEPDEES